MGQHQYPTTRSQLDDVLFSRCIRAALLTHLGGEVICGLIAGPLGDCQRLKIDDGWSMLLVSQVLKRARRPETRGDTFQWRECLCERLQEPLEHFKLFLRRQGKRCRE